jgi:hypothetical protein
MIIARIPEINVIHAAAWRYFLTLRNIGYNNCDEANGGASFKKLKQNHREHRLQYVRNWYMGCALGFQLDNSHG